jgi:hypothetical protein
MFEILTKEQVEKMSDRELNISLDFYRYNTKLIQLELNDRSVSKVTHNIIITKELDQSNDIINIASKDIKARGRKKKVK